jgi:hypothetical protein
MGCCGDKRAQLRASRPTPPRLAAAPHTPPPVAAPAPEPERPDVTVEHVGRTSVRVRGPASGRLYTFTPARRVQPVDAADVPILLRSRMFREAR